MTGTATKENGKGMGKKKEKEADTAPLDLRNIKTPRQLATLYSDDSAALENCFVKHSYNFYKRSKNVHFKKDNDDFNIKIVLTIEKSVKEKILRKDLGINVYIALYDFASAIHAFQTVMPYIRKHNRLLSNEKKKALNYIEKLCNNKAIAPDDKECLRGMKKSLCALKGGDYFPLYFLDFLRDLGYTPGHKMDKAALQHVLGGLHVELNVKFPQNKRADLFLFQTLQIVVYDLLRKKQIKLNNKKRYYIEGSDKNRDAMELTARIINSYMQGVGIKGLPVLTEKAIETTLSRNLS
jgi:hypothetical protein